MEEFGTIVDIKANFKDLEQLAQKTMQAKSKIDVIPGQLSYSLSGALSELSGVWTGELEALQQELEHDIRKYSEGLGETVQHIQKTAQGLKEMDMVMNAILMPSNIVLHTLSKVGFDVTSKRFISYQGRITPATSQLMTRYKKGELYSYDTLFPKPKKAKVKAKNNYEAEILEAVKNHKVPSPEALQWSLKTKGYEDSMNEKFFGTKLTNGQVASFTFDFLPFLGSIKAVDEARTGKQHFTGAKLDTTDRAIAGASVLGAGFTKIIGTGAKMVLKGKPLSEQTHLMWNKKTGEVSQGKPKKTKGTGHTVNDYLNDIIVKGDVDTVKMNKLKNAIQNNKFSVDELSEIRKKMSELGISKEYDEVLIKINFGKYFQGLVGDPPTAMINPHAHHILFKKGLGQKQQELVREGQEILKRYGIDPIIGRENLVWAPNAVVGQHSLDALEEVVNRLKAVEFEDGDLDDIVETLEELGVLASRR
jgi:uncharacterized protein YukE